MAKKSENFNEMKVVDLKKRLAELDERLRTIRFKSEGAKSKNVKETWSLKKQVARILTAINNQHNQNNQAQA